MPDRDITTARSATEGLGGLWDVFWPQVDASGDCWEWTGYRNPDGYGSLWVTDLQRRFMAHRLSWELLVGAIPTGLQIDHLCRNRACVNPDHVEPVTPAENNRRIPRSQPPRCPRGHVYDDGNTYVSKDGSLHCRTCGRDRKRRATQRRRNAHSSGGTPR